MGGMIKKYKFESYIFVGFKPYSQKKKERARERKLLEYLKTRYQSKDSIINTERHLYLKYQVSKNGNFVDQVRENDLYFILMV